MQVVKFGGVTLMVSPGSVVEINSSGEVSIDAAGSVPFTSKRKSRTIKTKAKLKTVVDGTVRGNIRSAIMAYFRKSGDCLHIKSNSHKTIRAAFVSQGKKCSVKTLETLPGGVQVYEVVML